MMLYILEKSQNLEKSELHSLLSKGINFILRAINMLFILKHYFSSSLQSNNNNLDLLGLNMYQFD